LLRSMIPVQPEEVDRVIGKMMARKGKPNATVLKYSGAVPYEGKHSIELEVNVGMSNNTALAMTKLRKGRSGPKRGAQDHLWTM